MAASPGRPTRLAQDGVVLEALAGAGTCGQLRAGAHLTAWRLGPYEWSAGLGWVTDSDDRAGAYVRLGMLTKQ